MTDNTNKKKYVAPDLSVDDLTRSLYEVSQKLDRTIKERDEMFANISHDLRSPITAIHNSIEYLESLPHISEEDIHTVLPLLSDRTRVLEKMINDIFLLTKLDSSDTMLSLENVPLNAFLEDFFYDCQEDRRFAGRKLTLAVPDFFSDTYVSIDPSYMKRVLDNLFSNALKYTKEDDTILLSAAKNLQGDTSSVVITVADTGSGISKEDLPHIFDRTYMSSKARTPSERSGAGLGLSICKSIVTKHNGSIWCESDSGKKGSRFQIALPAFTSDSILMH